MKHFDSKSHRHRPILVGPGSSGVALGAPRTLNETIAAAALPLFIGGNPAAGVNEFFNGFIDQVSLYDNALSASEVAALVPESSIVAMGSLALFGLVLRRRRSSHRR